MARPELSPSKIFGSRENALLATLLAVLVPLLVIVTGHLYTQPVLRVVAQGVVMFGLWGVYAGGSLLLWRHRQVAQADADGIDRRIAERSERATDRGLRLLVGSAFGVTIILVLPLIISLVLGEGVLG